jgi:hypothetical protein
LAFWKAFAAAATSSSNVPPEPHAYPAFASRAWSSSMRGPDMPACPTRRPIWSFDRVQTAFVG